VMLLRVVRAGSDQPEGEPTVLENEVFICAYGAVPLTPPFVYECEYFGSVRQSNIETT
jgi:hypothetical protein